MHLSKLAIQLNCLTIKSYLYASFLTNVSEKLQKMHKKYASTISIDWQYKCFMESICVRSTTHLNKKNQQQKNWALAKKLFFVRFVDIWCACHDCFIIHCCVSDIQVSKKKPLKIINNFFFQIHYNFNDKKNKFQSIYVN